MVVALNDSSESGISSSITLNHFKLLKQVGQGDIGNVYLTQLKGSQCMFAMKVFDKKALMQREKLQRMQNEREILKHLRHPFLPTVYAQFEAEDYSCLVMDYCSGGDLHSLRLKQHGNRFGLRAARFYAAEVLVALEYLHMMGIIYRDLKPENVLVREDGHIMLTDFDLSITCDMKPKVIYRSSCPSRRMKKKAIGSLNSWLYCCSKPLMQEQLTFPEVIIEPREACSMSFVGTHEYLAPEIIKGSGHGSPVDWWAFGIFVYELLFGRTPFKGKDIESTLMNVIQQPLRFPEEADLEVGEAAKGLIRELLRKDPRKRLGAIKGAAEIKQHGFFKGINWALLRSAPAPHIPLDGDNTSPKFQPLSYLEYF